LNAAADSANLRLDKSMPSSRGRSLQRRCQAVALALGLLAPSPAAAGKKKVVPPPDLPLEHQHPSGRFTFRTPADWVVSSAEVDKLETWGSDLGVRFVYRDGESGFDSLHVDCMLERLAPAMDQEPRVLYEYDFISGAIGDRRALDSAFAVRYDQAIRGHRDWRQRNVTVVGAGQSLCLIGYAPAGLWKKSKEAQALLNAVLASVTFK
jgi:hypothetical protein